MKRLLVVAFILALVGVAVGAWQGFLFLKTPPSTITAVQSFSIEPGETFRMVAARLEAQGYITSEWKFRVLARVKKMGNKMRVGEYALRKNMRPFEVLQIVTSGKSMDHRLTVQEGLNIYEVAQVFEQSGLGRREEFLQKCRDPQLIKALLGETVPSLEGYLFPETYSLTKYSGAEGLIRQMVGRFHQVYKRIEPLVQVPMKRHQVVIMASIVEKETGAPEERPLISSVYHNRLRKPMRLQADPTVLYGLWEINHEFKADLLRKDLETPTPYNTYTNNGLPLGPIANPGEMALLAAAAPAQSKFYFFVSRNDGTHVFSEDYEAHKKAVREFQINRKAREGRSWRELRARSDATK